jgi:hypothetical protein
MTGRTKLIDTILAAELKMFCSVPAQGPNPCLACPEAFKMHREAQFSIFSTKTLESYLEDLTSAVESGRNLMTHKYARMDNLIPRQNHSPLVDKLTGIMTAWQLEVVEKYPDLMKRARPVLSEQDALQATSFETYLRAELETYSENTLYLLDQDLEKLLAEGKNGSEEVYHYLVKEQLV